MKNASETIITKAKSLSAFLELKTNPMGFVDIGARGGIHPVVDDIREYTAVMGFEPDQEGYAELVASKSDQNDKWAANIILPLALSQKKEERELHLHTVSTNHSLLESNPVLVERYQMDKWKLVGKEKIETISLDEVLAQEAHKNINWGEFIKLDTQGTEFEILQGATNTLRDRTVCIICEVSFCELYQNQKLFSDIELFLRSFGFTFYGFTETYFRSRNTFDKKVTRSRERIIQADAIFFKDSLDDPSNITLSKRQAQILSICAMKLNYFDLAAEIAEKLWASPEEIDSYLELLEYLSRRDPAATLAELKSICVAAEKNTNDTNIIAGKFVDSNRHFCNYAEFS